MNAQQVVEKLFKAIKAVEEFRLAQQSHPREAAAAIEMFEKCYPKRGMLIAMIKHHESDCECGRSESDSTPHEAWCPLRQL